VTKLTQEYIFAEMKLFKMASLRFKVFKMMTMTAFCGIMLYYSEISVNFCRTGCGATFPEMILWNQL
jgi:hypothetical protein